mgnify:CR=1 FL=1
MAGNVYGPPIVGQGAQGRFPLLPLVITLLLVLTIPIGSGLTSLLDLSSVVSFLLALGLVPLLAWALIIRRERFYPTGLRANVPEGLLGLLAAWGVASMLWSEQESVTLCAIQPLVLASALCWVLTSARLPAAHRTVLLKAWVLLAMAMSIHAVAQFFGLEPLFESGFLGQRGGSILPHPNVLGGHLAVTLPLVGLAYPGVKGRDRWLRYGIAASLMLGTIATLSRAALLAVFVSMLLLWWLNKRGRLRKLSVHEKPGRIAPILFVVGGGIALLAMVLLSAKTEHGRFLSVLGISGRTRLALWSAAGKMFTDAPILGHGYGSFPLLAPAYRPDSLAELHPDGNIFFKTTHSEYFQQISEVGIIGLALLLGLIVSLFRRTSRDLANRDSAQERTSTCIIAALTALVIHSLLNSSLRFPILLFDMILLMVLSRASATGETSRKRLGHSRLARWAEMAGSAVLVVGVVFFLHDSGTRALSTAFYDLGKHHLHAGESDLADLQLQRSLGLYPGNIEARYLLASRHFAKAEYSLAYREYLGVWREAPYFTNVLFDLGVCALQLERPGVARSWFFRSRALNPYREDTLKALELIGKEPPREK